MQVAAAPERPCCAGCSLPASQSPPLACCFHHTSKLFLTRLQMKLDDIAKRRHVGLLAGGSGLTPMLQVAEEALRQRLPIKVGGWVDVDVW